MEYTIPPGLLLDSWSDRISVGCNNLGSHLPRRRTGGADGAISRIDVKLRRDVRRCLEHHVGFSDCIKNKRKDGSRSTLPKGSATLNYFWKHLQPTSGRMVTLCRPKVNDIAGMVYYLRVNYLRTLHTNETCEGDDGVVFSARLLALVQEYLRTQHLPS